MLRRMMGCALVLLGLATPQWASGWEFDEHTVLGQVAYHEACREFGKQRLQQLSAPRQAEFQEFLCSSKTLASDAHVYGRLVAYLADHVTEPKKLESEAAELEANDLGVFTDLVLANASHFWPNSQLRFESAQVQSIQIALEAQTEQALLLRRSRVRAALYTQAYGTHFLQDMFSSGHSGFSRATSGPNASFYFHNFWNRIGREMAESSGTTWYAFGDKWIQEFVLGKTEKLIEINGLEALRKLHDENCMAAAEDYRNWHLGRLPDFVYGVNSELLEGKLSKCGDGTFENVRRIVEANKNALLDLFTAYATGSVDPIFESDVRAGLPRYTKMCSIASRWEDWTTGKGKPGRQCMTPTPAANGQVADVATVPAWFDLHDPFPENVYNWVTGAFEVVRLPHHRLNWLSDKPLLRWRIQLNVFERAQSVGLFVFGWSSRSSYLLRTFELRSGIGVGADMVFDQTYGKLIAQSSGLAVHRLSLTDFGLAKRNQSGAKGGEEKIIWMGELYYRMYFQFGYLGAYLGAGAVCDLSQCGSTANPAVMAGGSIAIGKVGGGRAKP